MAKSAPYFPFYPDDWLDNESIFEMGLECEGAYIRLLSAMWKKGGYIPDKSSWICNLLRCKPAKWEKIRATLVDKFCVISSENECLFNQRLLKEFSFFQEKSKKSSRNATKRWSDESKNESKKINKINDCIDANAMPLQCYTDTDTDTDINTHINMCIGDTSPALAKKQKSEKSEKQKFDYKKFVTPDCVDRPSWDDWMEIRKSKKAMMTELALSSLLKTLLECQARGINPNVAMTIARSKGWKGLEIDWVVNSLPKDQQPEQNQRVVTEPPKAGDFKQVGDRKLRYLN